MAGFLLFGDFQPVTTGQRGERFSTRNGKSFCRSFGVILDTCHHLNRIRMLILVFSRIKAIGFICAIHDKKYNLAKWCTT